MDPQSFVFTPQNDVWRLSNTIRSFQETQQEHADRLMRLERRQDEDARVKSVWGPSSPFPNVLGGTPQQGIYLECPHVTISDADQDGAEGPIASQSMEFADFDDEQPASMIRSLHLDADDEPRRFGAASRANSVRFDESANQTLWSHTSKSSVDFPLSRSASGFVGLGGHPLYDRSGSHRSDGRQSSAGHSMSGRANSFGVDTLQSTPSEPPGLTPGLFILGSVPSIVRCWLDTNFKHDALLYVAVCSGSYKSYLDIRLINKLGLGDRMSQDINGDTRIKLSMYLPEAALQPASSRPSSPAPQIPTLTVDFTVIDSSQEGIDSKAIQVFLGSDTLRAHNADILFSTNTMTLYDDERNKLSLPLVRPENEETFKSLYITSMAPPHRTHLNKHGPCKSPQANLDFESLMNGHEDVAQDEAPATITGLSDPESFTDASVSQSIALGIITTTETSSETSRPQSRDVKHALAAINTSTKSSTASPDHSPTITGASRTTSSPAIWSGNWRRDSSGAPNLNSSDWSTSSRQSSAIYMRPNRDQGIKVLKPSRQVSRSTSSAGMGSASPVASAPGQSRYFDDGRRKTGTNADEPRRSPSGGKETTPAMSNVAQGSKLRSVNPVGGASAFGWLNSGQAK